MHEQSCCFANLNLSLFWRSRWRCRRRYLSSLLFSNGVLLKRERRTRTGYEKMKNGNKAENGKWSYRWGLGSTEVLFPFFSFSRFPCSFPVLVKSFCNAQTKEALSGDTTARYDLRSARPTDHLPFCVEVAKLRAKSLFLSIILLEVLFVSEWSKSNKKLLVLWSRKYLYSPHRGSLDILNGKGGGGRS